MQNFKVVCVGFCNLFAVFFILLAIVVDDWTRVDIQIPKEGDSGSFGFESQYTEEQKFGLNSRCERLTEVVTDEPTLSDNQTSWKCTAYSDWARCKAWVDEFNCNYDVDLCPVESKLCGPRRGMANAFLILAVMLSLVGFWGGMPNCNAACCSNALLNLEYEERIKKDKSLISLYSTASGAAGFCSLFAAIIWNAYMHQTLASNPLGESNPDEGNQCEVQQRRVDGEIENVEPCTVIQFSSVGLVGVGIAANASALILFQLMKWLQSCRARKARRVNRKLTSAGLAPPPPPPI